MVRVGHGVEELLSLLLLLAEVTSLLRPKVDDSPVGVEHRVRPALIIESTFKLGALDEPLPIVRIEIFAEPPVWRKFFCPDLARDACLYSALNSVATQIICSGVLTIRQEDASVVNSHQCECLEILPIHHTFRRLNLERLLGAAVGSHAPVDGSSTRW